MFYKICYDLTSSYLSSLVPRSVNNISQNSLRNADSLQSIHARTNINYQSFLPSVVREWNNLSDEAKHFSSVTSFKNYLNRNRTPVPKYFYIWTKGNHRSCIQVAEQNVAFLTVTSSQKIQLILHFAATDKSTPIFILFVLHRSKKRTLYLCITVSNNIA